MTATSLVREYVAKISFVSNKFVVLFIFTVKTVRMWRKIMKITNSAG